MAQFGSNKLRKPQFENTSDANRMRAMPLPPPPVLPAASRILVVSLRRIGDALLTTPLIRSLRRAWPDAKIDVLAYASPAGIIEGNPDINRVIVAPARPTIAETAALVSRLFKRYHLAVSTQPGDRPTAFAVLAGRTHAGLTDAAGPRLGYLIKRALLHRSVGDAANIHRVDQMLRLADALGIPRVAEMVGPAAAPLEAIPAGPFAVIHAAPMFRYKQWTAAGWRALAAGLRDRGLEVIAVSGPGEAERRYLDGVWQGAVTIRQFSWPQNVALLSRTRVYVGTDTSITHLAAATGCPTLALFGPMDPRVWGPWPVGGLDAPWQASGTIQNRGNVWIVQNPLPCLPCTFEGCERHIESGSVCLEELTTEQVLAAADQALAIKPRSAP
jgi:heptosyltransferase III